MDFNIKFDVIHIFLYLMHRYLYKSPIFVIETLQIVHGPYMKKLLSFITLILVLMPLWSCVERKTYKIGISQCSSDDWRQKMNEEVIREAMLHDDVMVEIRSADANSLKQIEDLHYFASNGFNVIMVAPNEAETLTPEVAKLHAAGIPVVVFDRDIHGDTYTQRIWVDNERLGKMAAEYAFHLVGDTAKVVEVYGLPGSSPAEGRHRGFVEELDLHGGTLVASAPADWFEDKARVVTDSILRLHPETNLIFAHNDRMAIGASKVADALGHENIKVIGVDAAPRIGVEAVADGVIDATFIYPTNGHLVLREAIKVAKGLPFEREVLLPTASAVDHTNADIILLQNETLEDDMEKVLALKSQLDDFRSIHNAQTALVWAIVAILILLFGVLFLVLKTFWSHRRHREALMVQNHLLQEERDKQKELNRRLEEATQSKLVFFTNVSHDLRTPLTLIAEPVAQLEDADNLTSQQKMLMKIADKNVKILQRLINQILDFRKFENNKLTLDLTEVDFKRVIDDWLDSFAAVARKRDIKMILNPPPGPVTLAIDVEKMERVFFNLISNALKYSPDNSVITVSFYIDGDRLVLKVSDTGEGISKEDMGSIFDRFFQVDRVRPRGSGIGLSLTKAFVELHGGSISVESELKKGSTFTITLPVVHVAEKVSEVAKSITRQEVDAELENVDTELHFEDDKPLLLVIDDNKDIRDMVGQLMKDDYNVIVASDGKDGIRKAVKYVPDLIVCDVMMPGIDGMETCSRLKSETVTSHIPVLMLTACTLDEQRVQGFDSGADGYLSKPFSTAVLKAQAASLIANRKRIKDLMGNSGVSAGSPAEKKAPAPSAEVENEFYAKFLKIFEARMGDAELNVETIASELGFERTQLYRKLKAITNYSPVELMRRLRLKKARHLLKTTDKSISEICYEVGFSTPAYFTKCYRDQFSETPSETRSNG